jgi:hypothetical protein
LRIICFLRCLCPQTVWASSASLFAPSDGATPLFAATGGGLFEDDVGNLFAPQKQRLSDLGTLAASGIDRALFDVIALAEAGPDGYDAVQHGARIKPPLPPSQMTLAQIFQWIDDTPGQHHAIGRYQIIPSTLRDLVSDLSLAPDAQFNPALQDRLALELVIGAD